MLGGLVSKELHQFSAVSSLDKAKERKNDNHDYNQSNKVDDVVHNGALSSWPRLNAQAKTMVPMSDQWPVFILQSIVVIGLVGALFIRGAGD